LLELAKTVHRFGLPYMLRLQKTYRTGWDEMIRGYLETTTMHALLNVGLIDEMQKNPSVNIDEFAAQANLEPAVLQPLCEAFYCLGMFERNGAGYSLSEKGRDVVEVMRGWLEVCYGYSEVFHSLEPLLKKEKVYGRDFYRRSDFVARGSGEMENLLFFPMVNDIIIANGYKRVLDLGCGVMASTSPRPPSRKATASFGRWACWTGLPCPPAISPRSIRPACRPSTRPPCSLSFTSCFISAKTCC
jgi:predicted transcriptional regulator